MALSGGINFDFSGLDELVADLGEVPREVISNVRKAVERTALNVKKDWIAEAKKTNGWRSASRRYPYSVDYDLELDTDGEIGAQIGPNLARKQGQLGFLEEAPGGVRSAPQRNKDRAMRKNLRDYEQGILKATEGLL